MSKIERSNSPGRFSDAEITAKVKENRAYWSSPAGIKRKAQLEVEKRSRKPSPTRFPQLAKRAKLTPELAEVQDMKARLGI